MTPKDKHFYQTLGRRIAQLRKAQGLTQTQLAGLLDISQQTVAHYEGGRLRVAVSMLPELASALAVSVEELIDTQTTPAKNRRGTASRLQEQIEQVRNLPRTQQKFVMEMLDTVLQQTG
ncbi:MAG TPA: XRE family transcriptional regulator [Anaerolineae bacterium]|nr:XRE family transcriptional regulator [Anaerolineae bacterium]